MYNSIVTILRGDAKMKDNAIVIPVYLNQAIVFDVIASLHNGLAKVERVHITEVH